MKNKIYLILGPSGSGKTSLSEKIFDPNKRIVTTTSRPSRKNEIDRKDYYFVSEDEFIKSVKSNEFLEWSNYGGALYGIKVKEFEDKLKNTQDYIYAVVDVNGYKNIKLRFKDNVIPIILNLNKEEVEKRLQKRNDGIFALKKRLKQYDKDIEDLKVVSSDQNAILLDASLDLDNLSTQAKSLLKKV